MAFQDNEFVLSDGAAPSAYTTGTAISENVYRQGPLDAGNITLGNDFGLTTKPFYLYLATTVAPTSGGSATLNVRLVSSAAVGLGTPTVHWQSGVLAFDGGAFDVGDFWTVALDPNQTWLEYIGIDVVIAGATIAAWKFDAFLTCQIDRLRTYAVGMNLA